MNEVDGQPADFSNSARQLKRRRLMSAYGANPQRENAFVAAAI
jgi:hypothetical protein